MTTNHTSQTFWTVRRIIPITSMLALLAICLISALGPMPTAGLLLVASWRVWQVARGWSSAPRWVIHTGMFFGAVAWWQLFPSKLTLEPAVGLLLVATGLKLLEAHNHRDAIVLVFSGFTLASSVFLFDQSLWLSLCILLSVFLGLVGLQESTSSEGNPKPMGKRLKLVVLTIIVSLPITSAWFFVFPRVAPLWAIPVMADSAKMGMSDTLRPGDISKLGQDASLAFRVQFDGDPPPFKSWYWRGITLGRFDDGTWRQHRYLRNRQYAVPMNVSSAQSELPTYTVTQVASQRSWLYQLSPSTTFHADVLSFHDGTYRYRRPITSDLSLNYQLLVEDNEWRRPSLAALRLESDFPAELNPRAVDLINSLADPNSPQSTVNRVLKWYREQPFNYTLEPPSIRGDDFVDQFLFDTQSGFCEHYAYSFVALMRLAGIPARIVGGYMGGEFNPVNNTIVVRELDAHAWAEVWFEKGGWTRIDPTGVVAPERVARGSIDSLEGTSGFLLNSPLSLLHFRNLAWINELRLRLDAVNYEWQTSIMNYRYEQQTSALKALLGKVSSARILLLLMLAVIITVIPALLWILWRRIAIYRDPMVRALRLLDDQLKQQGVRRQSGETVRQAFCNVAFKDISQKAALERDIRIFESRYYANKRS